MSVIKDLIKWRKARGLSQSKATDVLTRAGVPVTLDSLQNWEIGRRKPNGETALALHALLLREQLDSVSQTGHAASPAKSRAKKQPRT